MTLQLQFPGGAWTDYSDLLIYESVEIHRRLTNDQRRSVVDTCRFHLRYDEALQVALFTASDWILFDLDDGATDLFTGAIAPNYGITKRVNVEPIRFEAVDNSFLLDDRLHVTFNYPSAIGGAAYKIFDADNSSPSIVWELLDDAGYILPAAVASGAPDIDTTIEYVEGTAGAETYRAYLDDLLSEYGHVFHFDASGRFAVYEWDRDAVTTTFILDEDVEIRHREQEHDGIEIEYAQTTVVDDVLLYRERLPITQASGEWSFAGRPIADTDYYPPDSDITDIWQRYSIKWLDKPWLERQTRLKNKDIALIAAEASDGTVEFIADTGVAIADSEYEPTRARVSFQNTSGGIAKIYNFEIHGKALYRQYRRFVTAPNDADNPVEYESRFLYGQVLGTIQAHATRFARAMNNVIANGRYSYEWTERTDREVGSLGRALMTAPNVDQDILVTEKRWNPDHQRYHYTGAGISEYSAAVAVVERAEADGTETTPGQTSKGTSDTVKDLIDDGYINTGGTASNPGTTTPTPPTVVATSAQQAVALEWDWQSNLTNLDRYEAQVSEDNTNWYSLDFTGTGVGTINEDTDWDSTLLIHMPLPLAGTTEAPTASTWHYRVRRVTKAGAESAWSTSVNAQAKPVGEGALAEEIIYANNIRAGAITAVKITAGAVDSTKLSADALAFPSEGLVAYYSLDGQSLDTAGNGHHGTDTDVTYVAGKAGQAGSFNGTSSRVLLSQSPLDIGTGDFTIAAWAYINAKDGAHRVIVGRGQNNVGDIMLYKDSFDNLRVYGDNGAINITTQNYNAGEWLHVAVTRSGTTATLWRNGQSMGTDSTAGASLGTARDWTIGAAEDGTTRFFDGLIDEVRIYDRALSAAEVASLTRFPGGVEPGVVDGGWMLDASIIADSMAAENFIFTKSVGSANRKVPVSGDVCSYLGKDPAGDQLDADPVGISIEEYNGEHYETRFKAAMRSGGGVADAFVSGFSQAGESVLSSPGLIWHRQTSPFTNGHVTGIAYGDGVLVGVGDAGQISRSVNGGMTWSALISNSFTGWVRAVAYGNTVFIAVGDDGEIARSTDDGVTWSSLISSPFDALENINNIAYGNGVWIAVGDNGQIARSTNDGATWGDLITSPFGAADSIIGIGYGNGVWIACGPPDVISRSLDGGQTWGASASNPFGSGLPWPYSVRYGGGTWVVVGGPLGGMISRSIDAGATWSAAIDNPFGDSLIRTVHHAKGVWIASGAGGKVARSTDGGRTWGANVYGEAEVSQPFGDAAAFMRLAYDEGYDRWVAIGYLSADDTGVVITSDWLEAGSGIVEQGSNANGEYVVFSSGLQVCWHEFTSDTMNLINTNIGTYGWSFYSVSASWTYPESFADPPNIQGSANSSPVVFATNPSVTACSIGYRNSAADARGTRLVAIGMAG